jgi:hypothetical protein
MGEWMLGIISRNKTRMGKWMLGIIKEQDQNG